MLIVVVVLVTLMTMTFRLGSITSENKARNTTITRLQRLENCLSGYYAAFGTYPPVTLHGSRNPWLKVSSHGIQNTDGQVDSSIFGWDVDKFRNWVSSDFASKYYQSKENSAWEQVEAACRVQPVGCSFPFPQKYGPFVEAKAAQMKIVVQEKPNKVKSERRRMQIMSGFDDGASRNIGRFSQYQDKTEWRDLQLFKFGLMSHLLPRYLVMMNSHKSLYRDYAQWEMNNSLPCNALTGEAFRGWDDVCDRATSDNKTDLAEVANIPSQAVCARWIANLAGIVATPHDLKLFGVSLREGDDNSISLGNIEIFTPGGFNNDSTSGQYILDSCSVWDGWNNEFFYYSPAPHQTYTLWSAGPNGRTFPPWISRDELGADGNKCVGAWTEDDIVSMSN